MGLHNLYVGVKDNTNMEPKWTYCSASFAFEIMANKNKARDYSFQYQSEGGMWTSFSSRWTLRADEVNFLLTAQWRYHKIIKYDLDFAQAAKAFVEGKVIERENGGQYHKSYYEFLVTSISISTKYRVVE